MKEKTTQASDQLDGFDRRLLDLMKENSRRTGEDLSELLGLSSAACLRRIQRLRKIGAIEREVAVVSPAYEPQGTTLVVMLTIDRHNPQRMDMLTERMRNLPEVERILWVTGNNDIVLLMKCASMDAFADFCTAHFHQPPVEGFETLVVLREY